MYFVSRLGEKDKEKIENEKKSMLHRGQLGWGDAGVRRYSQPNDQL